MSPTLLIAAAAVLSVAAATPTNSPISDQDYPENLDYPRFTDDGPPRIIRYGEVCGFRFPLDRPEANVVIKPLKPLSSMEMTIDFRVKILTNSGDVHAFSYHDGTVDWQLRMKANELSWAMRAQTNKKAYEFTLNRWTRLTIRWDGFTGKQEMFVDGVSFRNNSDSFKGSFRPNGVFMLGQDQDAPGTKLDPRQRLVGDISNFKMWDQVLTDEQLQRLFNPRSGPGSSGGPSDPLPPPALYDDPPTYEFRLNNGARAVAGYGNCR